MKFLFCAAVMAFAFACGTYEEIQASDPTQELASKPALSAPILTVVGADQDSISIQVCAGESGAPAGFSVQWGAAELEVVDQCLGSFSGNANQSRFRLDSCECVVLDIGNLASENGATFTCNQISCGQDIIVRAFAHGTSALKRSPFTQVIGASAEECVVEYPPEICL